MTKYIFSIITITFNAEKNIERTINSVLNQSYKNIEYLIIDGASTDGTISLVERGKEKGKSLMRFELFSEPDNGLYDAMNKGLHKATGDYIWFLNAGDEIKSNQTVEKLASICENNSEPDIIYGETDLTDEKGTIFAERRLKTPKYLTWKSFRMGMLVSHQAFIAKKNISPDYDLQYKFSADFDWCIRCMKKAKNIVNSHLKIAKYQYEGTTTANRKASLKERYDIMCKYYGTVQTLLRHIWFAIRFYWAKIFKNNC